MSHSMSDGGCPTRGVWYTPSYTGILYYVFVDCCDAQGLSATCLTVCKMGDVPPEECGIHLVILVYSTMYL